MNINRLKPSQYLSSATEEMKMISFDDFQDKYIGKIGTPKRDAFEKKVKKALKNWRAE